MLYCIADAKYPMDYVSSGNLVNNGSFLHPKRNLDTFVLILVQEGILHITQGKTNFDVHPNEFILLFPHQLHYGYKPSEGRLSYYWTHFHVTDPAYNICNKGSLLRHDNFLVNNPVGPDTPLPDNFLLPEYGELSMEKRSTLLFVQLLDIAKRENYRASWRCHYALSLLLLEVTQEAFSTNHFMSNSIPIQILDIIEWIRTHYDQPLTVNAIAEQFNYHPTYLTTLFKKYTGYPIITYINRTRINVAKNLLSSRSLSVYRIADMCGFADEKHFMKLFKKYEGMTPTQYRKAFHQKKVNITII